MPIELRKTNEVFTLKESLKPALSLLREYIQSSGGCDHSVGICYCEDIRILEEAEKAVFFLDKPSTL